MSIDSSDKVILVSDFGRSGQGWLSYMLCYVLNAKYIEPYDLLKGKLYTSSEHVLKLTGGNLPGGKRSDYSMVVKTHNYPANKIDLTDKVIMLRRDPRDVAVSTYYMKRNLAKKHGRLSIKDRLDLAAHRFSFISHFITIRKWLKFYRAWSNVESLDVTYENLSANTKHELKRMLDFLGCEADEVTLDDAVLQFTFEKITGRKKGEEVVGNSEFRKGVIGDYKNHFSGFKLKLLQLMYGKQMDQQGYGFSAK